MQSFFIAKTVLTLNRAVPHPATPDKSLYAGILDAKSVYKSGTVSNKYITIE
jgi:hypothetical protein